MTRLRRNLTKQNKQRGHERYSVAALGGASSFLHNDMLYNIIFKNLILTQALVTS
jgi:hypothetical protein